MYSKICSMFDKLNAVYFMVSSNENKTILEIKRFDDIKEAILFYDVNKDKITIPDYKLLTKLGVSNVRD